MERAPISVVMAAWNAAPTIARALDSIAAQTVAPAEVIVVDDASTDATAAIAEAHPLKPRIVRHAANRGGAAALQSGLEAAANDWVAFLDADDEWLPEKLAAQVDALVAEPQASIVATGFTFIDREGQPALDYGVTPFPHEGAEFWRNLLVDSAILQSSALVRRDLALADGGVDASMRTGYDQKLFVRLAGQGPVAYVHRSLVRYHDAPGSLTKLPRAADILPVLAMHERHLALFADRLTPAEQREIRRRRYAEAATGLVLARAWGPALRATAMALKSGEPPTRSLWRLVTNLPPGRQIKRLVRG
ncbi:glycosyltransferase family 2 protein [Sphingoaurantiacus capsulatus]|uniref:Glycosyltransferase family 2 protein n=1 Tax=Sphingoaurantiacus capsulatus TaxID=1771310 RepID=A0ABV7XCZ9_9SPHN